MHDTQPTELHLALVWFCFSYLSWIINQQIIYVLYRYFFGFGKILKNINWKKKYVEENYHHFQIMMK